MTKYRTLLFWRKIQDGECDTQRMRSVGSWEFFFFLKSISLANGGIYDDYYQ
jgi:hypothetical protein